MIKILREIFKIVWSKKMKKKIVLILLGIYILFTFRISIEQNGDVFLRIIPVENIEYLFVPWKLKKMWT